MNACWTPFERLLAAWLVCLAIGASSPALGQVATDPGWRIMTDRSLGNCLACHALPGQTGVQSTFGPGLAGVGARYSGGDLRQWVADARQLRPGTLMPPFGTTQGLQLATAGPALLTPQQIDHVVATLLSWR